MKCVKVAAPKFLLLILNRTPGGVFPLRVAFPPVTFLPLPSGATGWSVRLIPYRFRTSRVTFSAVALC